MYNVTSDYKNVEKKNELTVTTAIPDEINIDEEMYRHLGIATIYSSKVGDALAVNPCE